MQADAHASSSTITDARIAEMERRGIQARRECRSRIPAAGTFSAIETRAYQRGWDAEQAKCCGAHCIGEG